MSKKLKVQLLLLLLADLRPTFSWIIDVFSDSFLAKQNREGDIQQADIQPKQDECADCEA